MSSRATLTQAEAAVLVEAARLFADPETGKAPRVTVQAWTPDLEAWWAELRCALRREARAPKAARR